MKTASVSSETALRARYSCSLVGSLPACSSPSGKRALRASFRVRRTPAALPLPTAEQRGRPARLYLGMQGVLGQGQNVDGLSVDLSSPFAPDQRACVISGGLSSLVNVHNFGSDIYGLDFIRLGPAGFRTRPEFRLNPKPSDYKAFNMYDTELYAPCTGRVFWAENSQIDQAIYRVNKNRPKANGVILACGAIHVKLAQMKMGSVLVKQGDLVKSGDFIGRAGNSGNSEEPHLHIHAETAVEAASAQVQGEPVHMRFNGKLMARGDCL